MNAVFYDGNGKVRWKDEEYYKPLEKVEMTLDSGSAACALPPTIGTQFGIVPGSRNNKMYKTANGQKIADQGQRILHVRLKDLHKARLRFRIADVHKPLVSAHEVVKRGNKIVIDSNYAFMLNKATGIKTELVVKNGVYTFPVWLDPEQRGEDLSLAPMENVEPNEERTKTASYFQRQAGWP